MRSPDRATPLAAHHHQATASFLFYVLADEEDKTVGLALSTPLHCLLRFFRAKGEPPLSHWLEVSEAHSGDDYRVLCTPFTEVGVHS